MTAVLAAFCMAVSFAQTVSGTVTEADTGEPVIGATIQVVGTTVGTITDVEGAFLLNNLPSDARELEISYVGMLPVRWQLSQGRENIVIRLKADEQQLEEVVVTAMGISRDKKALGYAVSEVKGSELLRSRGGLTNPVNALQGQVAGLQISSSSGAMGGSSKILIRGVSSISGSNQPLFVIDGVPIEGGDFNSEDTQRGAGGYDYGNLVQDINPDDIEGISVLKGASASALYGSRANNGVVLISTKKGASGQDVEVSFSSTTSMEVVNKLPKFQNLYGGGSSQNGFSTVTINGIEYQTPDYVSDESWGPRFEGQEVLSWYDLAQWEANGKQGNPTTSKWLPTQHDVDEYFETGYSFTNNLSVAKRTDQSAFRVSYTNSYTHSYMPGSKLQKNMLNATASQKSNNQRLELFMNITYTNQRAAGRPDTGYGDDNVMTQLVQWGQRQLDMSQLKACYLMPDGSQAGWNRKAWDNPDQMYHNNPYWTAYMNAENDSRHRVYGNVGFSYRLWPWLKLQYKTNLDYFSEKLHEHRAVGSYTQSYYREKSHQQYELNQELLLMGDRTWGDWSLHVTAGANLMHRHYELVGGETNGGLAIPLFYNLKNSVETPTSYNELSRRSTRSVFANASVGWKNLVYLEATLRGDRSSTLPKGNNTYLYPSVTGSFLFSELLQGKASWLTFGKLRAGWAKVGSDTDPYRLLTVYDQYTNIGSGAPGYVQNSTLNSADLKPESTYSWEVGMELSLFANRLGLDFTYYSSRSCDQIVPFSVSGSTGYTSAVVNAGELSNRGIELSLRGTPVQTHRFEWDTTLTLSRNRNRVEKLIDEVDYYCIAQGRALGEQLGAMVGHEYGVIMGTDYVYDANGNRKVDPVTGLYQYTDGLVPLGSAYPKVTGGWNHAFRLGRFDAGLQFGFQQGGHYMSATYGNGCYSGVLEETAADNIRETGLVLEGVVDDQGTPNTKVVSARDHFKSLFAGPHRAALLKTDYVRLREVSVGYTFPLRSGSVVKSFRLSAYGRNLAVWGPDVKHLDPDVAVTSSGNVQGLEGGPSPSVANYGVTVNLKF